VWQLANLGAENVSSTLQHLWRYLPT
jgi:hypothetical protein